MLAGWPGGTALVFGIALSVASTVVLTRALQERRLMDTERGHLAVGWLVVQDLLMVLVLVMLPAVAAVIGQEAGNAGSRLDIGELARSIALTIAKVGGFIAFMLVIGRRAIPLLLHYVAHTGSRELFRLAVLSVALGVAFAASQLFDVSFALGAFVAGMTLSESALSQVAAEESLPLRDAFAVLFFVSVGMLFDPMILIDDPLPIAGALILVLVITPAIAFVAVRRLGGALDAALLVAVGAGPDRRVLVHPRQSRDRARDHDRARAAADPGDLDHLDPAQSGRASPRGAGGWRGTAATPRPRPRRVPRRIEEELPQTSLTGHVVLVGYGRVGRLIGPVLRERGWPLLVIENADDAVEQLKAARGSRLSRETPPIRASCAPRICRRRSCCWSRSRMRSRPDRSSSRRAP